MKTKLTVTLLSLAAALILQACTALPATGSGSTDVPLPVVSTSNPGVSSGFPTSTASDCLNTTSSTQSADCASTAYPAGTVVTPQADGSIILTLDNQGQTLVLHVGGSFLLKLGDVYTWTVTVADPSILSREPNVLVVKGAQGIYQAHKVGTTVLTADGDPVCRQSKPACGMPSILVQFTIEVQP